MDLIAKLRDVVGEHILTTKEEMIPYLKDASYFTGEMPVAVVIPGTTSEVSMIMGLCNENKMPVTVRSGGTSLTGSSILQEKGVIISMSRFDKILETQIVDKYVVVESGVRLDDLNTHLAQFNHFYPPDPASSLASTVGGTINTNAGGLRASMYGTTKDWVLGMEVVLPSGEVVHFGGKTLKKSLGYDFTALMIGSEGTLGIVTKAILKIWPVPEATGRILSYFTNAENTGQAVSELKKRGITPLIAEYMDKMSLESIRKIRGISYPENCEYMLIIDISSTRESLQRELQNAAEIIRGFDPIDVKITTDPQEMQKMYEARKGLYSSTLSERDDIRDYVVIGDVVVPASELPSALKEINEAVKKYAVKVVLFGHIGDGNIHANIFADIKDEAVMKRVNEFHMELGKISIRHGGSVSAEHGIGVEKKDLLLEELKERDSLETLELFRKVKTAFDPNNILNRGKIFD